MLLDNTPPVKQSFGEVLRKAQMAEDVAKQFDNVIIPFTLRKSQVLGIQCGLYWDRYGLYHDVRTGKTIIMLLLAIFFARYGKKSVFLLPPILFDQVVAELEKIENHGMTYAFIEGSAAKKKKMLGEFALNPESAPDITIMTSNIFSGPFGAARKKASVKNWRYVANFASCLFFDECHLGLQDEESLVFFSIESFIKSGEKRLILSSGTPITTELASAYPQIRLKTPEAYSSRTHFDNYHVNKVDIKIKFIRGGRELTTRVPTVDSYKNVDRLRETFFKKAHRVSKFDVLSFAEPNVQVIPIKLHKKHMALYKEIVVGKLVEQGEVMLDLTKQNDFRHFVMRAITSPEYMQLDVKENAVLDAVEAICGTIGVKQGNKLILFANYNTSVRYLREKLSKYNPAVIYGGDDHTGEINRKEVAKFKTGSDCNLAIINPQAGGVGLTLGDVCQASMFVEPVSSPSVFEQAAARIVLDKQTAPSVVYVLSVMGTLSSHAIKRLLEKGEEILDVVRDNKSFVKELLDQLN